VTLTSATLATRTQGDEPAEHRETAFSHVMARLGCENLAQKRVRTVQVGSPFDYATQVDFVVDTRADVRSRDAEEEPAARSYTEQLAACVSEHLEATDGGAFVLFTSFATLHAVARVLRGRLEELGMPMFAQGLDGSREEILKRFREDGRSVLFGAASFWQGVDVRGRGLRNVIITKLPFEPPDRPLTEARGELIEARGGNPFMEDALPRAVIRFKQGFGRLIRSREDRGRVAVLDGRIVTARYGRLFLAALPAGVKVRRIQSGDDVGGV
jgi:ATP-dependent DNA helicase DinG